MYLSMLADYQSQLGKGVSLQPDLELGLAIKQIRLRMGMTQNELARDANIKPTALKTLENGYAKYTKLENLEAIARVLRVNVEDILIEGRELSPSNFFVLRQSEPSVPGKRQKKRRQERWIKQTPIRYEHFRIIICSPVVKTKAHYVFCLLEIEPGHQIDDLKLPFAEQLMGFVQRGSLQIQYEDKNYDIFGNQGFCLRADKKHSFKNMDQENPLRIFLSFPQAGSAACSTSTLTTSKGLSIGQAIASIRNQASASSKQPVSYTYLAAITGIDERSIRYLEKTTRSNQVIYWDKIETLTQQLGMRMEDFLALARSRDKGYLYLATALDRAFIDYRHYLGVRIKSTLFPNTDNRFHMSEMYVEPKKGIRRSSWRRKDQAMMCLYVEDGEIRIEVGKTRKVTLKPGESVYFDGNLGYIFTNPGIKPCKLIMTSYPAIVF